eukprot:1035502-Lingulodinium_polyedra.AAC.1
MANCIATRTGAGVRRLGDLDGLPTSTICWWHPSQPSLTNQSELPDTDYIVLRTLLGATGPAHAAG